MEPTVPTGRVDRVKLAATAVARARDFDTGPLGFSVPAQSGPGSPVRMT